MCINSNKSINELSVPEALERLALELESLQADTRVFFKRKDQEFYNAITLFPDDEQKVYAKMFKDSVKRLDRKYFDKASEAHNELIEHIITKYPLQYSGTKVVSVKLFKQLYIMFLNSCDPVLSGDKEVKKMIAKCDRILGNK